MKKGILKPLLLYAIGFTLAGISYKTIGHSYIHAPGVHHLILFLTIATGLIWNILSMGTFFFRRKTKELKWVILTHSTLLLGCFLYIVIPIYLDSDKKTINSSNTVQTLIKGDTTKIYHNDNLIYIKVRDSVLLDLR